MFQKYSVFLCVSLFLFIGFEISAQIECNQSQVNVTCAGNNNGAANVDPTGGIEPYMYDWSHNDNVMTPMAFPIGPGDYTVTITDAVGTSQVCNFNIPQPATITIESITEVNPSCGLMNGSLEIFATPKGNDPNSSNLMYSIDGGMTFQPTPLFENLGADDYLVIVLDGDFCFANESPQLVDTEPIEVMLVPECNTVGGNINIDLLVTGGTPDYDYEWEGPGGAMYITQDLLNVPQGEYFVTVTDRVGCSNQTSVLLENCCDNVDFCNGTVTDSGCAGENTGVITVNPIGGVAPYSYSWSHDLALSNNEATGLAGGMYMVTITDDNGCMSICDFTVGEGSADLIADVNVIDAACGIASGSIEVLLTPGTSSGTCDLSFSFDGGFTFQESNVATNLSEGNYQVVVNCDNCSEAASVDIDNSAGVNIMSMNPYCIMDDMISIDVNVTMGTPPYSYAWTGPNGFTADTEDLMGVGFGQYELTVRDVNGCEATQQTSLYDLEILDVIESGFTCDRNDGVLEIMAGFPDTGSGSCDFLFSVNGSEYQESNIFSGLNPGTFDIKVKACDFCEAETTYEVVGPDCFGWVGDFVWNDLNGNGVQDPGEPGVPNVRVELHDENGFLIAVVYTDEEGHYHIYDVPVGDYYLQFYFPSDYFVTDPNAGGNDNNDSDVGSFNGPGTTQIFTVEAGENVDNFDLGLYQCVEVGELVWFDTNKNDLKDPSENGINGLRVELYKFVDGTAILWDYVYTGHKPGTPSDDGYYKFCVPPGDYYVAFDMTIPGLVRAVPDAGPEDVDSDITGANGQGSTATFTLTAGNHRCDIAAGFYAMASVGDRVWVDQDVDGVRDLNEPRVAGVKVEVVNVASQNVVRTAYTDSNGEYTIDYLAKDDYYVRVTPPPGYNFTAANMGSEDKDSDIDHTNGANTTQVISTKPGEHFPNVDAGLTYSVLPLVLGEFHGTHENSINRLFWSVDDISDISNFELLRMTEENGAFESIALIEAANVLSYSFDDLDVIPGGNYYYQLKSENHNGSESLSQVIHIRAEESAVNEAISFDMRPNPAAEFIIIDSYFDGAPYDLHIHDVNGKRVRSMSSLIENSISLDISEMAIGMYHVKLISGTNESVQKLVVIR